MLAAKIWGVLEMHPPQQKAEIFVKQETSLSQVLGPGARKLEFFLIDHMVSSVALWSYKSVEV